MSTQPTTIGIIGTGYVGLTTAALLANSGFKVFAIDINPARLTEIKNGRSFFYEEGIDPLIKHAVDNGSLTATDSYEESIPQCDVVFSSVGTPDNPDGSSNLEYVFSAAQKSGSLMKKDAIYVQKSTVPVGTGERVKKLFVELGVNVFYVSNPEFLREGTAVLDTLWFDRVVVGSDDKEAANTVINVYKQLERHSDSIAELAGLTAPTTEARRDYIVTGQNSAELIKVTANAFLALKISFANSIAKLADKTGADINEVMDAVGADKRIGRAFLNAGRGYGGGCFPKDVSGLIASATDYGVEMGIMREATEVNESMPGYIANKLKNHLNNDLKGKKIAILGLAFKAGTSDTRKSPAISLANILSKAGAEVSAYDPEAMEEAEYDLHPSVRRSSSTENCAEQADVVCVATDWKEFTTYDIAHLSQNMNGKIFVDCMNAFDSKDIKRHGMIYIGVGRS